MAATLDHLSDGRAELGIGAGWLEAEHQAYGFDFPPAARRVDLVEEQLQVIGGLWSQDPFTTTAGVPPARLPLHAQACAAAAPDASSSVAARPPSVCRRLAARYADEYVINMPSIEQCRAAREQARPRVRGATVATRRRSDCRRSWPSASASSRATSSGFSRTYRATNPQYTRMLDSRDNWIMGTPEQAQAQLQALAEAGIERALMSVNCDLHREMLALLAV